MKVEYRKNKTIKIKKETNLMPFLEFPTGEKMWECFDKIIRINKGDTIKLIENCKTEAGSMWFKVILNGKEEGYINPSSL